MDALQILVDEVALEGLDGITIPSLWVRLEDRVPKFPLILDPATKEFLWRALVCDADIEMYELPQKRAQIVLSDRFAEIDPETGIQEIRRIMGPEAPEDVYSVNVIEDDKRGIQGSCKFFKERKNITPLIRTNNMNPCCSLEDAYARWEDKLVIVASQTVRYRALIGLEGDPELRLSDHSYCVLERLGRARWQGELQRDLHSRAFNMDAGKMHYLRKSLDRHGLITLQSHVARLPSGGQQHSILLLLKRFHVDRRSKYDILMEKMSNILSTCPDNTGAMVNLRDQLRVCERTFKRVYQYMMAAKLVQVLSLPLQTLNPDAVTYRNKKGADIMVRCLKLLKAYGKKKEEDENEENDDEDGGGVESEGHVIERDTLTQAYEIVISSGTNGISQSTLRTRMNIGKLEGRMICRILERYGMIKGFMEDVGRQRTNKYIGKTFVEQSDLNQQFVKEKARSEQLRTRAEAELCEKVEAPRPEPEQKQPRREKRQTAKPRRPGPRGRPPKKGRGRTGKSSVSEEVKPVSEVKHLTPVKEMTPHPLEAVEQAVEEEPDGAGKEQELASCQGASSSQARDVSSFISTDNETCVTVVEELVNQKLHHAGPVRKKKRIEKPHQTYRLLKRKNLIIEAVRSVKVIESLFTLQKMIVEEERLDGVSTKCCKKSIMRLLLNLSREGMLKLFRTTVIQDGVRKKVEFVVHPSITPDDPLVKSAIEQIRFRISSSYSAQRNKAAAVQPDTGKGKEQPGVDNEGDSRNVEKGQTSSSPKNQRSKTDEKMGIKQLKDFRPSIVPGLGRSLGFQPKMPRLRVVHSFLWYLIYGHPLRRSSGGSSCTQEERLVPGPSGQDGRMTSQEDACDQEPAAVEGVATTGAETDEERAVTETVYVDEMSWRRYIPPVPVHRGYGCGWALTSDILLSLPLSVFVQIIQVSYKIDDLDLYLNDPMKQHYLIRFLPGSIKRQLLYKRKYIFNFYESMQRLCYMGLLQFGPVEKFQDKDQVFVFLKQKATIMDTTTCEPHYNLATSPRPFDHRSYTFATGQDVENYWDYLHYVCLNTPLGVVRWPRTRRAGEQEDEEEAEAPLPMEPERPEQRYTRLAHTLRGSREVTDDGTIPGDSQGAGGLDSCFFGHLKRNWIWTSYLLKPKKTGGTVDGTPLLRLKNLLKRHPLPLSMCGGSMVSGTKEPLVVLEENVRICMESGVDRNSRVVGGKKRRRRRQKAAPKTPKRRRRAANPEKKRVRLRFHDEADRTALLRMTRQRVTWTPQEDSLLMLCRVASHFLNRKIKKPFVPWQVIRDLLHAQFEASQDKTSLAVGRRSRYIMKNPQTDLNFKICLAEVYQDKSLIQKFHSKDSNYSDSEVCASEFKDFVAVLRQKFSSVSDDCSFTIPDSKDELFRRFKVYAIGEHFEESRKDSLTSLEDIHSLVLNNLIQSTLVLSSSQMKSCRSFQTFHMYRRYKDDVLYKAFLKCQRRGLVNRRRVNKVTGPKKSRALPFLPMSYQLSQSYYRCFAWRFPGDLCVEAHQCLEMLESSGREDRPSAITFLEQDGGGDVQQEPAMVHFSLDSSGGSCMASLSLMMLGLLNVQVSIPEHIVVVDSTLVDNEVMKSFAKEVTEEDEDDDEAEKGGGKKKAEKIEVKARQASHTNYLLMRGYSVPGIVSLRNLSTTDNIVVNSCTMRLKLRRTPAHALFAGDRVNVLDDPRQGEACLPVSLTRVLRPCRDSSRLERFSSWCIHQCGYSTQDLQAVLDVSSTIEAAHSYGCDWLELARSFPDLQDVQDGRTRAFQQYLEDLINLEEVVEVGGNSMRLVARKYSDPWLLQICELSGTTGKGVSRRKALEPSGEEPCVKRAALDSEEAERVQEPLASDGPSGADADPPKVESEEPVSSGSATLTECQAGGEGAGALQSEEEQAGAPPAQSSSLLASSADDHPMETTEEPAKNPTEDTDLHPLTTDVTDGGSAPSRPGDHDRGTWDRASFVSRPWRIVDGSLNKSVCKGMMEALLYHIMSRPGLPEPVLMEHYRGVLQPVVVLELLQVLEELGCVRRRYMVGPRRALLFSPPCWPEVKEQVKLRESARPFYEPTVDCCLRLSRLFPDEPSWNKWVQFPHS